MLPASKSASSMPGTWIAGSRRSSPSRGWMASVAGERERPAPRPVAGRGIILGARQRHARATARCAAVQQRGERTMNQDTGISPRRVPGRSIILVACALVVAFVGVFWLLGSVVARDHGIGAGVQPTPTVAAGTGMRGHLAPVFTLTDQ